MGAEPNNLPPPLRTIITLIVITIIVAPTLMLVQWWLYYSESVLLWDTAQTMVVSYAGLALAICVLIVISMRKLSRTTDSGESEKIIASVSDWTGWVFLLIAFSFSESTQTLHISKHIYFPLALFGLGILGGTYGWKYKKQRDKTNLISGIIVLICVVAIVMRYLNGVEKLTS